MSKSPIDYGKDDEENWRIYQSVLRDSEDLTHEELLAEISHLGQLIENESQEGKNNG